MMQDNAENSNHVQQGFRHSLQVFIHPRVIAMLFLGFSAGIPLLLIFSSLSLWLREAGVERSAVTYFSWAALAYSFKFVWAPLIDKIPLPLLTNGLGRRRGWMLAAQLCIIGAIVWMALIDPSQGRNSLTLMALAAVLLAFSSATQDIVIDAYRIESAATNLQAIMSSSYIAGYRIGMLVTGAGALFMASRFGSELGAYRYQAWQSAYLVMAVVMLVGVFTTLVIPEPEKYRKDMTPHRTRDYVGFLVMFFTSVNAFIVSYYFTLAPSDRLTVLLTETILFEHLADFSVASVRLITGFFAAWLAAKVVIRTGIVSQVMMDETYIDPVKDFFARYKMKLALMLLLLVGLYRISDIVLGAIANVFYQDLGFSKIEIASVVKTFGLLMTIAGGFLGGILAMRFGVMRILFLGALLSAATNLLFMLLAGMGHDIMMLYLVISADNLSGGLAGAAFIAFLSSLTNIQFTAMQYAILSSLMTLLPKILGGYSGTLVDSIGYSRFFIMTALMGIPVLVLIWVARQYVDMDSKKESA